MSKPNAQGADVALAGGPMSGCNWPECGTTGCAKCRVMDVCRAQVQPALSPGEQLSERITAALPEMACAFADRLLAWLRWPGALWFCFPAPRGWSLCSDAEAREMRAFGMEVFIRHPLDTDERGRRLRGPAWCWRCRGTGTYVSPVTGHDKERFLPCAPHKGPDWEYTAIITDMLTELSMWGDVHAWRPARAEMPLANILRMTIEPGTAMVDLPLAAANGMYGYPRYPAINDDDIDIEPA